jgi:hypothetical protein
VVGDGWWSWWIPLRGGDVSVGVVFDERLVDFPKGDAPIGDRLKEFLSRHPVGRELLADAQWIEGDTHWRKNLPYCTTTFAGDGFVLVGDAAAFLDPLYSPGMDMISFTVTASMELIAAERRGEVLGPRLAEHNANFLRSYWRWFTAIYKDKYEYLGDFELMRTAFQLDLGLYYLGIVSQPFKFGAGSLRFPPFSPAVSAPVFYFMALYNRRIAAMARERRRRGVWGRQNARRQHLFQSFSISPRDAGRLLGATARWLRLELSEGWRTWWGEPEPAVRTEPVVAAAPECAVR